MSGLAALFHRDGRPADMRAVGRMLAAIPYRGPDGAHAQSFGPAGLGHARTIVTLEDVHDAQPLVSPRTGCAIVADVRLDNREELLASLPGRPGHEASDADLILRAYEAWGLDAPVRLLGDFAFVIWDPRAQCMVCARDTSGQRALFYRLDRRTFAAASEVHQLFQDPTVPMLPNEERIREYLIPLNTYRNEKDNAATFFAGIYALPAGRVITIERDLVRLVHYWELSPPAELRYRRDDEYAEHFRALFMEVVRTRLRSVHPVGALLSGGLDSASIVCTALELMRSGRAPDPGFASISSVFAGLDCDEETYIRDVQAKYDFPAHFLTMGAFAGRLQLVPGGFREAPNMGIAEARDVLLRTAQQARMRVLLTGEIADACIGGARFVFDSLLRQGRFAELWRHLQAYRRVSDDSLRRIVGLYCLAPLLPIGMQRALMARHTEREVHRFAPRVLPFWMPEALRDDLARRYVALGIETEHARRFSNPTREMEFRMLYPPEVSRHPAPWPMQFARPFADRRLHAFLLAVPPERKWSPMPGSDDFYAGSKRILRGAMRGILPESVRTRAGKTRFGAVLENEISRQWPTYEAAFGPASCPEVAARGYVDQQAFWSHLQELRGGQNTNDIAYVMAVVQLETWLRALALPRPQRVTVPRPWGAGAHAGGTLRLRPSPAPVAGV